MAYQIRASGAIRKDLKRLEKALQEEIRRKHFPKIKENPFQAHSLIGEFRGLRSYRLRARPVQLSNRARCAISSTP